MLLAVVEDTDSKPPDTSKDILPACKNDQSVTSPQEVQSATKPGEHLHENVLVQQR